MSLEGHQVTQQGLDSYMQDIRLMPVIAPACRSGDQERPHITYTTCIGCLGFVTRYWVRSIRDLAMLPTQREACHLVADRTMRPSEGTVMAHGKRDFVSQEGVYSPSKSSPKGGPGRLRTPPLYLPPFTCAIRRKNSSRKHPAHLPWLDMAHSKVQPLPRRAAI